MNGALQVLGTIAYYVFIIAFIGVLMTAVKHTAPMAWASFRDGSEDLITRVLMLLVPVVALWMAVGLAIYAIGTVFGAEWRVWEP